MQQNMHAPSIITQRNEKQFTQFLICFRGNVMENLLEVVEQFLSLSDEKLEELAAKNHLLRLQEEREEKNA